MKYEAVIGLEVHAQLLTRAKLFSASGAEYGGEANTRTDPVVLGMPGVLPVLNRRAVEYTVRMGLATNCTIAAHSRFARKHYFYPDLPKGYQISQFDLPFCSNGYVEIDSGEHGRRRIRLNRIHLEEDAGKSIHDPQVSGHDTLIDLNRSGVALIEIVSEPDLRTAAEAYNYLTRLKQLVTYLKICDGNMEEGSLRCDANVSIRPLGASALGVKTEVKNMNSFRNVEKAITYEIARQIRLADSGKRILQETLLWDANAGKVRSMRSKEEAHDYRYFPEPDLPPVDLNEEWINRIRAELPELPEARKQRFGETYGLPAYDAEVLTGTSELADYYEAVAAECRDVKLASNFVMSDVLRILNEQKIDIDAFSIRPGRLAELLNLVSDRTVSLKMAKTIYEEMLEDNTRASDIIEKRGLTQISDSNHLLPLVEQVLAENPAQVAEYLAGKEKLMGFFVGQIMKHTAGKADPAVINGLLRQKLQEKK